MADFPQLASAAEWEAGLDLVYIGLVNHSALAERPAALRALVLEQVPPSRFGTEDFATSGDLKTLGYRFFGFDAFRTTHNSPFL